MASEAPRGFDSPEPGNELRRNDMISVKVYPVIESGKVMETIKCVYLWGVLVYRKRILAPHGLKGDNYYQIGV